MNTLDLDNCPTPIASDFLIEQGLPILIFPFGLTSVRFPTTLAQCLQSRRDSLYGGCGWYGGKGEEGGYGGIGQSGGYGADPWSGGDGGYGGYGWYAGYGGTGHHGGYGGHDQFGGGGWYGEQGGYGGHGWYDGTSIWD